VHKLALIFSMMALGTDIAFVEYFQTVVCRHWYHVLWNRPEWHRVLKLEALSSELKKLFVQSVQNPREIAALLVQWLGCKGYHTQPGRNQMDIVKSVIC